MSRPPVVAVGFLTQRDLDRLGKNFSSHIPIPDDDVFADLLTKLDRIEIEPLGTAVVLRPS